MRTSFATTALLRAEQYELPLCVLFNRANNRRVARALFGAVSRLGNGVLWYTLILSLPVVYGFAALGAVAHLLLVGVCSLAVYKWIKRKTLRDRPCTVDPSIIRSVAPLDRYSFPSGHTLHAVAFTVVLLAYFPTLVWLVVPFTLLVATSRLVLGLHYPSDVLAGALIGGAIAFLALQF